MSQQTITVNICDLCNTIECKDNPILHVFKDKHICNVCYQELHLEYLRIFHKQVPDRRGGMRQLGEIDT